MSGYGTFIITQEDLEKAKRDLIKEVKALKKKYSFLHSYEIKAIILEAFSLGRKTKKIRMFGDEIKGKDRTIIGKITERKKAEFKTAFSDELMIKDE